MPFIVKIWCFLKIIQMKVPSDNHNSLRHLIQLSAQVMKNKDEQSWKRHYEVNMQGLVK